MLSCREAELQSYINEKCGTAEKARRSVTLKQRSKEMYVWMYSWSKNLFTAYDNAMKLKIAYKGVVQKD